jgi:hypothetical protein
MSVMLPVDRSFLCRGCDAARPWPGATNHARTCFLVFRYRLPVQTWYFQALLLLYFLFQAHVVFSIFATDALSVTSWRCGLGVVSSHPHKSSFFWGVGHHSIRSPSSDAAGLHGAKRFS